MWVPRWTSLVVVGLAGAVLGAPFAGSAFRLGEHGDFADKLNEDGKRGWELVSLVEVQHAPGRECLLVTFKRQVLN
jgi:hypothetical protein